MNGIHDLGGMHGFGAVEPEDNERPIPQAAPRPCLRSPVWYKSAPYRSRVVIDPRGVLSEFGLDLSEDVEIRVWDSTAELRYMVLPERPAGTEGMDEARLAELVSRDAMIGVAKVPAR